MKIERKDLKNTLERYSEFLVNISKDITAFYFTYFNLLKTNYNRKHIKET